MESNSARIGFFKEEELIYRRWTHPRRDMMIEQMVLPRRVVLDLVRNIHLAGHMGKN